MAKSTKAKSLSEHYLLKDIAEEVSKIKEAVTEFNREIKLETAPADYRFPTTNQSRHCFTRYVEYHRCIAAKGEGAPECDKFAKYYRSLCPAEWVDRWNEQRGNGTFPVEESLNLQHHVSQLVDYPLIHFPLASVNNYFTVVDLIKT